MNELWLAIVLGFYMTDRQTIDHQFTELQLRALFLGVTKERNKNKSQ